MKLTILFALLILAFGCGPAANNNKPDTEASDELMADILTRSAGNQTTIEITLYRDLAEILDGKINKGFGKNVVAVENPQFNGVEMTPATNLSGQPIYKAEMANAKASNVVTATLSGKRFEGSTMLETRLVNKMTTVTLAPVEKSGP